MPEVFLIRKAGRTAPFLECSSCFLFIIFYDDSIVCAICTYRDVLQRHERV